jgi:hypothetical protein
MTDAVLVALISAGVVMVVQGWLAIRGKRQVRPWFFEKPLLDVIAPRSATELLMVVGRLRLAYGIFLILIGVWGLFGL